MDLRKEPVFREFYEICQVPHGSGNEQALAQWLLAWAEAHGLPAEQDATGNVFLRKPAGAKGGHKPTVLLQAHMDMVCEKRPGSTHDFAKDPIPWVVEGDFLTTGGETSLGADDGIGVALILALLEKEDPEAPPLEALFTVMEEADLSGALNFDMGKSRAAYLINLDHTGEGELLSGSCGGMEVDVHLPLEERTIPEGAIALGLQVAGLLGGHSGDDIHRGRGNANKLLARLLKAFSEETDVLLTDLAGGSFRLAIPRDAAVTLAVPAEALPKLRETLASETEAYRADLQEGAAGLTTTLTELGAPAEQNGTPAGPIADLLLALPDGPALMSQLFEDTVALSDNLGEVRFVPGKDSTGRDLEVILEIRAAHKEQGQDLFARIAKVTKEAGGTAEHCNEYPGWNFRETSPLREHCAAAYRALYGEDPTTLVLHCGLEVGCLLQRKPDLDAVSLGPNIVDLHSVSERLDIPSVRRVFAYLESILKGELHGE